MGCIEAAVTILFLFYLLVDLWLASTTGLPCHYKFLISVLVGMRGSGLCLYLIVFSLHHSLQMDQAASSFSLLLSSLYTLCPPSTKALALPAIISPSPLRSLAPCGTGTRRDLRDPPRPASSPSCACSLVWRPPAPPPPSAAPPLVPPSVPPLPLSPVSSSPRTPSVRQLSHSPPLLPYSLSC